MSCCIDFKLLLKLHVFNAASNQCIASWRYRSQVQLQVSRCHAMTGEVNHTLEHCDTRLAFKERIYVKKNRSDIFSAVSNLLSHCTANGVQSNSQPPLPALGTAEVLSHQHPLQENIQGGYKFGKIKFRVFQVSRPCKQSFRYNYKVKTRYNVSP